MEGLKGAGKDLSGSALSVVASVGHRAVCGNMDRRGNAT
jgi:hypothetical protein